VFLNNGIKGEGAHLHEMLWLFTDKMAQFPKFSKQEHTISELLAWGCWSKQRACCGHLQGHLLQSKGIACGWIRDFIFWMFTLLVQLLNMN
jgi:hypothetical protein